MNNSYDRAELEPACFYLRKSREDQEAEARGEGETLAKHRKALFNLAKEYGISITKIFAEVASGESLVHRPEMLAVLKEVAEGKWKSVWCMDVDRLGRGNMQEQGLILETFKLAKALIVTPRKVYDLNDEWDEEYSEFEAFMARKELKIITRRLQGGRIRSVSLDKNYLGTRPPYGYLIEKQGKARTLIPHPEQAEVVKLIFELYTNHMGTCKIAKELNRLGKPTYSGKTWKQSTVLFILKNEIYIGRLQWRKKETKKSKTSGKKETSRTRPRHEWIDVEGKHEPLVDKAVFAKVQKILKSKYHVPYQLLNGITNPLAGLIRCDFCGASMVYRPYVNRKPHLRCYNTSCPNKSCRFDYVENVLIEGLRTWLVQYRRQYEQSPPAEHNLIHIKAQVLYNLNKELKELDQQKERLYDLLEKGIYDEQTYLERSRKLSERRKETESSIAETAGVLDKEIGREKASTDITPTVKELLKTYDTIPEPAIKNGLLKSVLDCAIYRKEKHQHGPNFTLVLYPRLPN